MRQAALSIPYLILFFMLPYIPIPNIKTMSGCTGCYLQSMIIFSIINVLVQSAFQIFLFVMKDLDFLESCQ